MIPSGNSSDASRATRFVNGGVERLADRFDTAHTGLFERLHVLVENHGQPLADLFDLVGFVRRLARHGQIIVDGDERLKRIGRAVDPGVGDILRRAFAVILVIGLQIDQFLLRLGQFAAKLFEFAGFCRAFRIGRAGFRGCFFGRNVGGGFLPVVILLLVVVMFVGHIFKNSCHLPE